MRQRSPGASPVQKSAVIDPSGRYRYSLGRRWSVVGGCVLWIMLNPSTANAEQDDPTIRRCIGFARSWGYGSIYVVNLFALRATNPRALYPGRVLEKVGPENDAWIKRRAEEANLIVAAWGSRGALHSRDAEVYSLICHYGVHHLGLTKGGHPRHPLYVAGNTQPKEWDYD